VDIQSILRDVSFVANVISVFVLAGGYYLLRTVGGGSRIRAQVAGTGRESGVVWTTKTDGQVE
jgi:hypothetical protein